MKIFNDPAASADDRGPAGKAFISIMYRKKARE